MRTESSVWAVLIGWGRAARRFWRRQVLARWRFFTQASPQLSRIVLYNSYAISGGALIMSVFWLAILVSVPNRQELRQVRTEIASDIYTSDGALLGRYYNEYRTVVGFDEIPAHVINALVATEDERFFRHNGIDYRSWARVFVRSILMGDESGGGGSTISQQLAKNLFPRKDYQVFPLLINKLREIAIAKRLERTYTKHEILALYLNTVPFPENIYGIERASRRFFSKHPSELTLEEGAILIGTLRATTYYNPARYPDRAGQRRNVVLGQMLKNGYLPAVEFDSLKEASISLQYNPNTPNKDLAPYFLRYVRQEVDRILEDHRKPNGERYDLYTDGLKVYTTVDAEMQRVAEEAAREQMADLQARFDEHWRGRKVWGDEEVIDRAIRLSPRYQQLKEAGLRENEIREVFHEPVPMTIFSWDGEQEVEMSPMDSVRYYFRFLQLGMIAVEPYTGFVRAWVGGIDHDYFQYDHVRARRQVGSVFKPVVYAQALRDSIDPCEYITSQLKVYHEYAKGDWALKDPRREDPDPHIGPNGEDEDDWVPQNADGKYGGRFSLQGALTNSVNTVSVDLIMRSGVGPVIDLAQGMGVESPIPSEPSIALGTAELSLFEMTSVFTTLASRGQRVRPTVIRRIETHDGQVLVDFEAPVREQVLSRAHADLITHMLESVTTYGTASRLRWRYGLYGVPIAGKTGTSQNHADGWFVGYTPKLVAGVWVGGDSPLVRFRNFRNGQGAATALPVYARFMRKLLDNPALADWHGGEFPELREAEQVQIDCPMYIPSPEELLLDSLAQDSIRQIEPQLLTSDSLSID